MNAHEISNVNRILVDLAAQGYARVFNMDQETALPRPDEDSRLEAALAVRANGAAP